MRAMSKLAVMSALVCAGSMLGCGGGRKPLTGGGGSGSPVGSGGRTNTGGSSGTSTGGAPGHGGAGTGGTAGSPGNGGNAGNAGSGTGSGGTAVGSGGNAGAPAACNGATDARLVVAPQRVLRLTYNELLNTIQYLISDAEAKKLVTDKLIGIDDDDSVESKRWFPPLQQKTIVSTEYTRLDQIAQHVRDYVQANYATLAMATAGCSMVTDACAASYLNKLAARAYRRNLTAAEQQRLTALYTKLRSQTYNGYDVPGTVEEATADAVYALLSSPQMLWRQEFGDATMTSTAPAGLPLTDNELATHLAFFLTDRPPDDMVLAAATAGSLRSTLTTQVTRLLDSQVTKDWLRTVLEAYFLLNRLPDVAIDTAKFSALTPAVRGGMQIESRMFLDNVLWKGSNVTDLLLSRTTFLNTTLATEIYRVPAPAGATTDVFVQTTLPSDKRAGLLTNAGWLTSRGRSDGRGMIVPRGRYISAVITCIQTPPPPDTLAEATNTAKMKFSTQTGKEQVDTRYAVAICAGCHKTFDPYGLALENYDTIGRWRDTDPDLAGNFVIDASTDLPAAVGGAHVTNAVQMVERIAASPLFVDCMTTTMLQYALADYDTYVEPPMPPQTAGCAAADVSARFNKGSTKSFSDLVRATAASPAFILRRKDQ